MAKETEIQALARAIANNRDSNAMYILPNGGEIQLPTGQFSGTGMQNATYADMKAREIFNKSNA